MYKYITWPASIDRRFESLENQMKKGFTRAIKKVDSTNILLSRRVSIPKFVTQLPLAALLAVLQSIHQLLSRFKDKVTQHTSQGAEMGNHKDT